MNREVLFRGKRVDDSKFIQGYFYKIWDKTYMLWGMTNDIPNMIEVVPETVGQYTGLKDKNGKEIFDGDRVIYLPYGDIFKVYWSNETFGWQLECIDSSEGDDGWVEYLGEFGSKDLEVIGNIHEEV